MPFNVRYVLLLYKGTKTAPEPEVRRVFDLITCENAQRFIVLIDQCQEGGQTYKKLTILYFADVTCLFFFFFIYCFQ